MAKRTGTAGEAAASIIDVAALTRDLDALGKAGGVTELAGRNAVLKRLSAALDEGRKAAQHKLEVEKTTGLEVARLLSRVEDDLVTALFAFTQTYAFPPKGPQDKLCIVATGGYGRNTLAPGSDVDIMFLYGAKLSPRIESMVEYMLYLLWDLGQTVGHATRGVDEAVRLSAGDYTIRTALLESRLITGDPALFGQLADKFGREILRGSSADFIEAKLAERDERHAKAGESRYLVEPNIKDGKGGLRDLHTLFWIGKHVFRVSDPRDLVGVGLLTETEHTLFAQAEDFLWTVRCHLHFLAGRAEERLTFDRQVDMASRLGYRADDGQQAVERFMSDYFRVAKSVGDLTRIICANLEVQQQKLLPAIGDFFRAGGRKALGQAGFVIERGRLTVRDEAEFLADPVNLLRLFQIADQLQSKIHPSVLTLVTRSIDLVDDALRADVEANAIFLEILTSRQDPERALRAMNEAGVLGAFIPDFGAIVARMQFNMYHHYTVDEHTIRCIGNLARIERGELGDELPLSDKIIHQVISRNALYVAMLLHDIAKGRPGDHSLVGAEVARSLCPRLGLTGAETATVAWLVENHLVMSDFAQRRDLSDPRTIDACADIIQSPERLRMLLCLTVADIRAVGPGVWNGWKGELLRQLYFEVEAKLQGGHSTVQRPDIIAEKKAAVSEIVGAWTDRERRDFLDSFDDPYWRSLDSETHRRHARLIQRAREEAEPGRLAHMFAAADDFRDVTQISIYTKDSPGLFAKLAGAISRTGGSIADAKAFTASDGQVIDVFWVQDAEDQAFDDRHRLDRLDALINRILRGETESLPPFSTTLGRRRQDVFEIDAQVLVDNNASVTSTLVEVNGRDRPGLLYELAKTLTEHKLSIASAQVATYGERAIDVFYVRDEFGLKITAEPRLQALRASLLAVLEKR